MNAGSSNKKTNHAIRGKRVIFTGTRIYKREAVSNKNIGLVARIRIQFNNSIGFCYKERLFTFKTLPDTTGVFVARPT